MDNELKLSAETRSDLLSLVSAIKDLTRALNNTGNAPAQSDDQVVNIARSLTVEPVALEPVADPVDEPVVLEPIQETVVVDDRFESMSIYELRDECCCMGMCSAGNHDSGENKRHIDCPFKNIACGGKLPGSLGDVMRGYLRNEAEYAEECTAIKGDCIACKSMTHAGCIKIQKYNLDRAASVWYNGTIGQANSTNRAVTFTKYQ